MVCTHPEALVQYTFFVSKERNFNDRCLPARLEDYVKKTNNLGSNRNELYVAGAATYLATPRGVTNIWDTKLQAI